MMALEGEYMMEDWFSTIKDWLQQGDDSSKNLVDLPWEIVKEGTEDDYKYLYAEHPRVPFRIIIYVNPYFANMYIVTDIETDALDIKDRMKIYKELLHMNSDSNLYKVGLMGNSDNIIVAVDLDLASLNKEEFNDALTALVMGTYKVIETLGLEEEFEEEFLKNLAYIIIDMLNSGKTHEEVEEFLVKRVGLTKDDASQLLKTILDYTRKSEDLRYIG